MSMSHPAYPNIFRRMLLPEMYYLPIHACSPRLGILFEITGFKLKVSKKEESCECVIIIYLLEIFYEIQKFNFHFFLPVQHTGCLLILQVLPFFLQDPLSMTVLAEELVLVWI